MMVLTLAGTDRDGGPFGTFLLDSTAGGGGAYADHDGLDASGDYCVPRPSIANVENNEAGGPFVYLYRRLLADTGGAGRQRGGATVALALTPHDVPALQAMLIGHGVEVPNSSGIFGGLEGSCNETLLRRLGDGGSLVGHVTDPGALKARGGVAELGPKPGFFELRAGDIFAYSFQGGGGFGDPIERDPDAVARDVEGGLVSELAAEELYGVVVSSGVPDAAHTEARRRRIRSERLGGADPAPAGADEGRPIGPALRIRSDGRVHCRCGRPLAEAGGDFKDGTVMRTVAPQRHGRGLRLHAALELREHACPGCGTLLESEVARKGEPSLRTFETVG
jgi:N-methylhydantoinase B